MLCAYIAHHKTAAVQELLLACPRKAKEVAVVERLMQYQPHEALTALEKEAEPQSAYAVIDGQVRQFAAKLGFAIEADRSVWAQFPQPGLDDLSLYEAVRGLSDHELDQLDTLLSALAFGQIGCQRLDTEDSLFNRVARDLCVDMRYHWHPDRSFLERRTRDQLVAIAVDCGYAENTGPRGLLQEGRTGQFAALAFRYRPQCRDADPGAGEGPRVAAGRDAVSRCRS